MSHRKRRRFAFRPTVTESRLEERVVLAVGVGVTSKVLAVMPPTRLAPAGVTPRPAPPPISARAAALEMRPLTLARLRKDYRKQVRVAARDLRRAIQAEVSRLDANGATPTAQQLADFNASIAGALNATALRLSVQAALLPNSGARLVPAIQDAILGAGPRSLASRLTALAQSGQLSGSAGTSARALTRLLNSASLRTNAQLNNFFNTTPVARLSVNSSGQRIPIQRFIGGQLLNQVANAFGSLAQSFPNVANSMLFSNGSTGTPTPAALAAFNSQVNNALGTAAFILGSGLSLFPRNSALISQLQAPLFGADVGANGFITPPGSTVQLQSVLPSPNGFITPPGSIVQLQSGLAGNTINSLASALQNLQFGSPDFNTSVSGAFSSAFQNLVTPMARFFNLNAPTSLVLPTSGFTSLFGSPFVGNSFFNGFNSGFVTGTNPGFIGFGLAPTGFNPSFGLGFNNFVTNFNNAFGFNMAGIGSGVNGIGTGANLNGGIGTGANLNGGIGSGNLTGTGGGIA